MIIFRAKTTEAGLFKTLIDLLANNIKTACFEIHENGIGLSMIDYHHKTMISLKLYSSKFVVYDFNHISTLYIGLSLNELFKIIRSVKKKDSIELSIDDENHNELMIKVIPKESTYETELTIKIHEAQNIYIEQPVMNTNPIIVSSCEFQKMVKNMSSFGGKIIDISATKTYLEFNCNSAGILNRKDKIGDITNSDNTVCFHEKYNIEQLLKITKITGLNSTIQIYTTSPLAFQTDIGSLGNIVIFIKSISEIEMDLKNNDSDIE